jgi:hypothetical protein
LQLKLRRAIVLANVLDTLHKGRLARHGNQ